ncbi:hypothetical protein BKA66DRAFT_453877 [Pyrenochaeta sp. MPI-SDFR-AT-0127]|nr:hypothetical protein BKA66DRAFT_453877 [Pyrenochaeta sp. MPI-SDFR-AT-0127]
MPLLTPSRIAVLVLSFSLISFFWTYGLPSRLGQPSLPIIDHYDHKNVHSAPIIPAPVIEPTHATTHGARPTEEDDHRWDDGKKKGGKKQTTAPGPKATGPPGHDEDGGRWEDEKKKKPKTRVKTGRKKKASATVLPTTLLTAANAAPTGENATNEATTIHEPEPEPEPEPPTHDVEKFCRDVRGAPHVMIVLRTSKAEVDKLPTHLQSLLSCVPNFAIFSDHSGEIDGFPIYNALESIGSEAKRTHDEFREYQIIHADAEHKPDPKRTKDLDKWKFLPMVYKAFHLNPHAKFYMFIEADTSISWTNLLQWINRLDYRIPYYSGAPTFMNSVQLAQRGSGILLSQGALRRFAKSYDELYTTKWEVQVGKECCGDLLLAMALNDAHVEFYSSWPLLQGEQPHTLDYTTKHWCVPAISWHHINGDDLTNMWNQERNWTAAHGWDKPYLFRDAFHEHVEPHMEEKKESWDNLSQDTMIVAPQGRQQQMKEEAERSRKAQEGEVEEKEKKEKEEEDKKKEEEEKQKEKEKQKEQQATNKKESLDFQAADSEDSEGDDAQSSTKRNKRDDKAEAIDWDKLAEKFKDAGDTPERCQKACEETADCLQWRYSKKGDGECHLGKVLRLGKQTEGDGGVEKWASGWLVDRVAQVTKDWECKDVKWQFYQ